MHGHWTLIALILNPFANSYAKRLSECSVCPHKASPLQRLPFNSGVMGYLFNACSGWSLTVPEVARPRLHDQRRPVILGADVVENSR